MIPTYESCMKPRCEPRHSPQFSNPRAVFWDRSGAPAAGEFTAVSSRVRSSPPKRHHLCRGFDRERQSFLELTHHRDLGTLSATVDARCATTFSSKPPTGCYDCGTT